MLTASSPPPDPLLRSVVAIFSTYSPSQWAMAGGPAIQDFTAIPNVNGWHPGGTLGLSEAIRSLLFTPEPSPLLRGLLGELVRVKSPCLADPPALCVLICRSAAACLFLSRVQPPPE